MSHLPLIKYSIKVEDEDTNEVIYTDWAYSMESLEEKFYRIDRVVAEYEKKANEEHNEKTK